MTIHLSSQEFVNAIEGQEGKAGALAPARQSHLDGCASCQAHVAELRALVEDAREGADVPEPSPLFWDHFPARVLAAVESEARPGRRAWWTRVLDVKTLVPVSVAVVAVAASVALYVSRPVTPEPASQVDSGAAPEAGMAAAAASVPLDGDEWAFVSSVMDTLEGDDIHEVLAPSHDAVDAAIEALTSDQRDRFMKLLKAEMSEGLE